MIVSEYENKTIEELIDLLEGKDDQIEELEQSNCEIDDLNDEIKDQQNTIDEFESLNCDREGISEIAFKSGYQAKESDKPLMKAWLNFKVENRI